MSKDDLIYVGHMQDTARRALRLAQGKKREEYDADENLRLALAYLIQVIGEAAAHVSADYRQRIAMIPWREIVGMRHKIVHDYLNVDENIVWDVVSHDLPALVSALDALAIPDSEE